MLSSARLSWLALALACCLAASAHAQDSRFDPHRIASPALRPLHVPVPERTELANGVVVFLLEDHTLPVVYGTAYCPASPSLVPESRAGLAAMTGDLMRRGGSVEVPGDSLDDRLAAIGANISTWISDELGYAGFWSLRENADEVVGLFAQVVSRPAFPTDKLELVKLSQHQDIASRNDEVIRIAFRLANRVVYGEASPLARMPEHATVDAVLPEDCRRLHAQVFAPERLVLAVYGDFDAGKMKARLGAVFSDWKRSGTPAPAIPAIPLRAQHKLFFAAKDDVTQSVMLLADLGHLVREPDDAAMDVVVQALGGGGQSRLNRHIRTERGLAYATGADAGAGYRWPGVFEAWSLTRNDSALTALRLLRGELEQMRVAPLGDEEFATAKESVQNRFVFNFERRSSALFRAAYNQVLGLPADYLDRYQRALADVTPATAFASAKLRIRPDGLSVIVVGKESQFEHPLERVGLPVERVDISIPAAKGP